MNHYWIRYEHYHCPKCGKTVIKHVRVPYSKKNKPIYEHNRHVHYNFMDCALGWNEQHTLAERVNHL